MDTVTADGTATTDFGASLWISRPVPRSARVVREIRRSRIDWAEPGHSLAQRFRAEGPVEVVNLDIAGPRSELPYDVDVRFTVALRDASGATRAEKTVEGQVLVWDWFGIMLEVSPAAPPGDYTVELRVERETIGWHTAEAHDPVPDDGVSPLPVVGHALADGERVEGIRLIGVETAPAPNPLFRRSFELAAVPDSATMHAAVLGTGVISVNGVRVGREALEPAVTDYDRTILYRSWEVAHLLRAGENEILVEAGRERFAARGGDVWGWNLAPWHREPMARVRLEIDGGDDIVTDGAWRTAAGPVRAERLFLGESWVLRDVAPDWSAAAVVEAPSGSLRRAELPPVLALAPKPPVTVERLADGVTVLDFGEVMVGRIRCRISGRAGASVSVLSGEQRGADGRVVCDNFLVAGDAQVDSLELETDADGYVFEPRFGYRGFRWMQITTTGDVTVDRIRAVPLYTELTTVGELRVSDPEIEWIDTAMARTFRNNLHGIPTDTPIYEKNGWTADAHLATEALLHHLDLRASFDKWMRDHRDAQTEAGSIPHIIPTPGWGLELDPTWSSSAVLIPWYLYREYGDLTLLESSRDMVRRFADHLLDRLGDGLWRHRTWGDWLAPGHLFAPEGMEPIGTIMCVTALQHTARILGELGDPDSAAYERAADEVAARYHSAYFSVASGTYEVAAVGFRQSLAVLPLAFGAVPAEHVDSVRASLIDDIEVRTRGHLDCGAVGVRHLLPVLDAAGRADLAVTVLTTRTRPGWGAWFDAGESTLLESWGVDARSRNHYFLGSVDAWIQQRIGGLRLTAPGWREFEVAPVDDPRVSGASIRHRTPAGWAAAEWERGPGGWLFRVDVPSGTRARVRTPDREQTLSAGRHVVRL